MSRGLWEMRENVTSVGIAQAAILSAPGWRTSGYSPGGRTAACVQAGQALLDLRDGSIYLDDVAASESRVLLRQPTASSRAELPPVGSTADPVEVFYAQRVETLLAENPVQVPALFAVLRRRSAAGGQVTTMREAFQSVTGRTIEEAVHHAVRHGQLSETDGEHVMVLAKNDRSPGASAVVPDMAVPYEHARESSLSGARLIAEVPSQDIAFGLLGGLDRDLNTLANLRRAWRELYADDLAHVLGERWPEHKNVLQDLLGHADQGPVPMAQVTEWYSLLSKTTFEHVRYGTVPVTPDHPEDGCYLRAYHWSAQLLRWGAMPRQVFATEGRSAYLALSTPYARYARYDAEVEVRWRYHTAPVVQAWTEDGRVVPMVLDPAFDRGPLPVEDWADAMRVPRGSRYVEGSLAQVHERFVRERHVDRAAWGDDGFPNEHMVLLTDGYAVDFPRATMSRTRLNASWDDANDEVRAYDDRLYRHAVRALRRDLARSLWVLMQDVGPASGDDADRQALDDVAGQALLDAMRDRAFAYGPPEGFLHGNADLAWAARRLLGAERYSHFYWLFPEVPTDEALVDDATVIVETSDEREEHESAALASEAKASMVLVQGAMAPDDFADLRELASASLVETVVVDGDSARQTADGILGDRDTARFEARRFQLSSGEWVSQASVRLRVEVSEGTSETDARRLVDELVDAVEHQVNAPRFRLPGGDLFHLDLDVRTQVHAAHHTVTLQTTPGPVSGVYQTPRTAVRPSVVHALHEVVTLVAGTQRRDAGPLLSATDLAAVEEVFRSRADLVDSPHPVARRGFQGAVTAGAHPGPDHRLEQAGDSHASTHEPRMPHIVIDPEGLQWASASRSARDAQGNAIPDDQRACVEVAVAALG